MERNFFRKAVMVAAILLGTQTAVVPVYAADNEDVVPYVTTIEESVEAETEVDTFVETESEEASEKETEEETEEAESIAAPSETEVESEGETEEKTETEESGETEETAETESTEEETEEVPVLIEEETETEEETLMETETEFDEETESIELEGLMDEEEFALLVENTTLMQETMEKYMTYRKFYEAIFKDMQSKYLPSGKNTDPSIKAEVHETLQASNCVINIDGTLPKDVYITLTESSVTDDEGTVIQMSYTITYFMWDGNDYVEYEPSSDARNEWNVSFQNFYMDGTDDYTVQTYDNNGNLLQTDQMVGNAMSINMGQYTSDVPVISTFLESDTIYGVDSAVFFEAYANGDFDTLNALIEQMAWNALVEQFPDIEFSSLDEMKENIEGMTEMLDEFKLQVEEQLALQAQFEEMKVLAAQEKLDAEALAASTESEIIPDEEMTDEEVLEEDAEEETEVDENEQPDQTETEEELGTETETLEDDEVIEPSERDTNETEDTEPVLEDTQNETVEEVISDDTSDTEPATEEAEEIPADDAAETAEENVEAYAQCSSGSLSVDTEVSLGNATIETIGDDAPATTLYIVTPDL